ncbi:MAG: type II toxin-antitoxin system VapC family toxin [Nocardioidaceae bacterium]
MKQFFIDTTIATYALGGPHPLRPPCIEVLAAATDARVRLHLSAEAIQEVLHHRMRRDDRAPALAAARALAALCHVHDFDSAVLRRSLDLVATSTIRDRDAVHAATALEQGFTSIVSADPDFDGIPDLRRIDPRDLEL